MTDVARIFRRKEFLDLIFVPYAGLHECEAAPIKTGKLVVFGWRVVDGYPPALFCFGEKLFNVLPGSRCRIQGENLQPPFVQLEIKTDILSGADTDRSHPRPDRRRGNVPSPVLGSNLSQPGATLVPQAPDDTGLPKSHNNLADYLHRSPLFIESFFAAITNATASRNPLAIRPCVH